MSAGNTDGEATRPEVRTAHILVAAPVVGLPMVGVAGLYSWLVYGDSNFADHLHADVWGVLIILTVATGLAINPLVEWLLAGFQRPAQWVRSAQVGAVGKTSVEHSFPTHLPQGLPIPSTTIPSSALLAELMKTPGNHDLLLVDTDPAEAAASNERLRAQLGEQAYAELVDGLDDDRPEPGLGGTQGLPPEPLA